MAIDATSDLARLCAILKKIVLRDFTLTIQGHVLWDNCRLVVFRPAVLRDYDNKYPEQQHNYVADVVRADNYYDPVSEGFTISPYMPVKRTDKLMGTYALPNKGVSERSFVEFVLRCCARLELHEIQENFYYDGQRIFDPHSHSGEFLSDEVRPYAAAEF